MAREKKDKGQRPTAPTIADKMRAGTLLSHECDGDSYACLTLSNEKTT